MLYVDSTAQILGGGETDAEVFPSTWENFRQCDALSHALQEYLYILIYYDIPLHYNKLYEAVYAKLVEGIPNFNEKRSTLPKLKRNNDFCDEFMNVSDGLLLEACFQFAIFFLCREFAIISGCAFNNKNPLNLNTEDINEIFNKKDSPMPDIPNRLFNRYVDTIKKTLNRSDNYQYSKLKKLAEAFYPIETNENFKKEMEKIFGTNNKLKVVSAIKNEHYMILNEIAVSFYKCITNSKSVNINLNTQIFASGNGGASKGFLGVKNLGLFLFPYPNEIINDDSITITKENVLHFYAFGFDSDYFSKIEVGIGSEDFIIQGNKNIYNDIRPNRENGITIPPNYQKIIEDGASTVEEESDVLRDDYKTSYSKMCFDRNMNDLSFGDNFRGGALDITLTSGKMARTNNDPDEFFLMVNVAKQKELLVENPTTISLSDIFDDDKFEVKKNTSMFYGKLNFFKELWTFIKESSPTIQTPLAGKYIGTYDGKDVVADKDYIPSSRSRKKERSYLLKGDKNIRYSEATIYLDKDHGEIKIDIWSTTSPRRSNLKDQFKSPHINENKESVFNTEDIDKYVYKKENSNVVYYNQPLAMLRSMAVLEAIAKQIIKNTTNNVEVVQEAMNKMMNNAIAEDESWEIRGKIGENYQVPNGINYETYRRFKWYKNCDEYELYDHSINFNEN